MPIDQECLSDIDCPTSPTLSAMLLLRISRRHCSCRLIGAYLRADRGWCAISFELVEPVRLGRPLIIWISLRRTSECVYASRLTWWFCSRNVLISLPTSPTSPIFVTTLPFAVYLRIYFSINRGWLSWLKTSKHVRVSFDWEIQILKSASSHLLYRGLHRTTPCLKSVSKPSCLYYPSSWLPFKLRQLWM